MAQPLEAQIVGVDKMLYMKSTSGNDGEYTLDVSFELGSNPDIDTVNVKNRVQTALAQLPQEVQLQGLKVQKKSSSILQFVVMSSETGEYDRRSSQTTPKSTSWTSWRGCLAWGRPSSWAR